MRSHAVRALAAVVALAVTAPTLAAQRDRDEPDDAGWLEQCRRNESGGWHDDGRERFCDVRVSQLQLRGRLAVDGRQNGGVAVRGAEGSGAVVHARVTAEARTRAEAEEVAREVRISTAGDSVVATGPERSRGRSWYVSYVVEVPRRTDLWVAAQNGGVSVAGVTGRMELTTHNGGMSLTDVGGDVRASTHNGGLRVRLAGRRWEGAGLDAETRNGGVQLELPDGYAAHLETGTVNGGFNTDIPITVQGRVGRRITTDLNGGGPPIRVTTTNGGVTLRRR
jgi:hypothetical protein